MSRHLIVTHSAAGRRYLIDGLAGAMEELRVYMEGAKMYVGGAEVGETVSFEVVEMTEAEIAALRL